MDRYHRQSILRQIGERGQRRLRQSGVLLVGCGALGGVVAELLVRAGVGFLRVVDRDVVEWTNLQRQVLFEECDAREGRPKAVAAAERLMRVNSEVSIEPAAVDVDSGNIEELMRWDGRRDQHGLEARATGDADPEHGLKARATNGGWVDLVVDGTDNVETRYLINDAAVKHGVDWIYGACVGVEGRVMPVRAGRGGSGACLRCVYPEAPAAGSLETCDTAGVLGPAAAVVASLESSLAIRMLTGGLAEGQEHLLAVDAWEGRVRRVSLEGARRGDCPACGMGRFDFLDRPVEGGAARLCGRDAVQIRPAGRVELDAAAMAGRLAAAGEVERNRWFTRCRLHEPAGVTLTLFPDGRAIVQGTADLARARSIYARYVGN